ncbi:hypothetical protein D3C73_990660 [compost metagenome]
MCKRENGANSSQVWLARNVVDRWREVYFSVFRADVVAPAADLRTGRLSTVWCLVLWWSGDLLGKRNGCFLAPLKSN